MTKTSLFTVNDLDALIRSAERVLAMEDDVLAHITCEAITDESGRTRCDEEKVCDRCLTQNRFSERAGHLRLELNKVKNVDACEVCGSNAHDAKWHKAHAMAVETVKCNNCGDSHRIPGRTCFVCGFAEPSDRA